MTRHHTDKKVGCLVHLPKFKENLSVGGAIRHQEEGMCQREQEGKDGEAPVASECYNLSRVWHDLFTW